MRGRASSPELVGEVLPDNGNLPEEFKAEAVQLVVDKNRYV
jgi:hypothetical protein